MRQPGKAPPEDAAALRFLALDSKSLLAGLLAFLVLRRASTRDPSAL
jgi:hypothetical protein